MIFSAEKKDFPTDSMSTEINSYNDQNDFEWKIAMVKNGFFIGYFGDEYFLESKFEITDNLDTHLLKNTGCFFIESLDFEVFCEFRNILKEGFTDDIWDSIQEFIQLRFDLTGILMTCEKEITNG